MLLLGTAAGSAAPATNTTPKNSTPTYLGDVLPILTGKCYRCHNEQATFLRNWLDYNTALADRVEIKRRVWDSWQGRYYKQPMPAGFSPELRAMTEAERLTGQGIPTRFPPLAGSDFLNADKKRAIGVLLHGLQGEVVVNGQKFNNSMPSLPFGDAEISSVLTFVYSSFGNSGQEVTPEEVQALRGAPQEAGSHGELTSQGQASSEPSPWE